MGKIIGNKKVNIKMYTEEELKELTDELNAKIVELTTENTQIKNEFDEKNETIENLNKKIVELTTEDESLKKDQESKKSKQSKSEE